MLTSLMITSHYPPYSMSPENTTSSEKQPTIISYFRDIPNLLSLSGLACTVLAIYCSTIGLYYGTMIGMVWAVVFDWADGLVARSMKGRTDKDATFGGQLDVVIDIVSYGVTPAVLLMSFGNYEPIYIIGAFIMLAAAAMRLSYFSTYGLSGGKHYTGLALDNNSLILVFVFLFESILSHGMFSLLFAISVVGLAFLNIAEIKTPKLSGNVRNRYILVLYTLAITAIYGYKMM